MKLLSLNGGGTCGYMTAAILAEIEKETNKKSYEIFDLVTGVSSGSIIAGAVGRGVGAKVLKELYRDLASDIFKKKCWIPWKSWYSGDKLNELVHSMLDCPLNTAKIKIMIYASGLNGPQLQPKFWKSWKEDDSVNLADIVVASCSAPIYFPPKVIAGNVYIDGGFVSNNPSLCGVAEAIKLEADITKIRNLNINSGKAPGIKNAEKLNSILKWIPNIAELPTLAIRTGERSVSYQTTQIIGSRNIEVGPQSDLPLDTLDFNLMDQEVNKMWENNKKDILALVA
jgi:patatin-like phospholipase/acyl hydrolase